MPAFIPADQKAPDLITDGFEHKCGCWELNSGPEEELLIQRLRALSSLHHCNF